MRAQVNGFVDMAFKLVGDLATQVTFTSSKATDFDFTTLSSTMSSETSKVISCIIEKAKKKGLGSYELKVMCKYKDIPDPSIYDKAIVGGVTYNVVTPEGSDGTESNGYTSTVYLAREKPHG